MSSNSKICPQCQLNNAAQNLVCLRCESSLIHVSFAPSLTEKYGKQSADRHYFLEEMFNPTFFVCIPLGLICVVLAILGFGTPLTAVFFPTAVILFAMPFFPGDPVGESLRRRIERLQPSQSEAKPESQTKLSEPAEP